jgi:hypothetical protein
MTVARTIADGTTTKARNGRQVFESSKSAVGVWVKAPTTTNGGRDILPAPEPADLARAPGRSALRALHDRLQIWVWHRLMWRIANTSDEVQLHKLPDEVDFVKPIPAGRRYPALGNAPLIFSELTPASEQHNLLERVAIEVTLWLKEWYGLGNNLTQQYRGIGAPYPKQFATLQAPPTIPEDFQQEDRLARVARRGPFSFQTKRGDRDDEFVIDLRGLEWIQPREPFIAAGGLARFKRVEGQSLATVQLEFRGAVIRPGDPGWSLAEKRFLTGLNSQTTFIEHLLFLHMATAGVWGIVARMAFSSRHPLRVLLQPFSEETNRVNNYNIDGLILTENSNVPSYSGYTLEQSSTLLREAATTFDVRIMDPEYRARVQGQLDDPTFPTVESAVAVFHIFRRFAEEWCRAYLKPEIDLETRIFCEELDYRVANGVRRLIGIERWDELTPEKVAHLLAVGMFASSVSHHVVNDLTRDYFLSFHLMAPAIDDQGYPTLGVVLEKQGGVFTAGIRRYKLLAPAAIPDPVGRELWARFQSELRAYEATVEGDPQSAYRLHPSQMSSSIHA